MKPVDEVLRAEFYRKGGRMRRMVKGKRWLLLGRSVNLNADKRQLLAALFKLNREILNAYLLKESMDGLWTYPLRGASARAADRDRNSLLI